MKRSEVNSYIMEAEEIFRKYNHCLPDFANWSIGEWRDNRSEAGEIIDCAMGWDVTDFGSGDYAKCGLLLFTLRNGVLGDPRYPKPYAEKLMLVKAGQVTPMHCHWRKQEDIINRGGGTLVFRFLGSRDGKPVPDLPVRIIKDGRWVTVAPGAELLLLPGSSVTLTPGVFHTFFGAEGSDPVITGEVSSVNDDNTDNCFVEERKRFPGLTEDVPPHRLLVADYANIDDFAR